MASPHLYLWRLILCGFFFVALGSSEHNFGVASRVTTSDSNRASMPLVHRHGPRGPSFAEQLRRDHARRNHIMSNAAGRTTMLADAGVSILTALGAAVDSLQYVVNMSIGTPAVQQTMLIDTGSDLSWIQCKPCNSSECYPQKDPLFDPSSSSTYAAVVCDSQACKQLDDNEGCTNGTGPSLCQYRIVYGGGEKTVGLYSTETLTLKPGVTVNNFSFGCGLHQTGKFDRFDGLLGLGGAPESLVSQTAGQFGGAFSYCLPPDNGTAGFLALGEPSSNNTTGFAFAPIHQFPGLSTFYMVNLTAISVGGKQLDIPATAWPKNGMIVDSGTIVTALPAPAYSALRSAFRSAMSEYPLLPPADGGLDTCYNFTGHTNVTVPKVALTFAGGATIDLDVPAGVLLEDCLAFIGFSSPRATFGIIGNVNQRRFEVLYDTGRGRIGFRPGAC